MRTECVRGGAHSIPEEFGMQAVTDSEMGEYLSQLREIHCEDKNVRFVHPEASRIVVDLRFPEPHQVLFLARLVTSLLFEERHFKGAYLWITQWGVWDPNVEAVAFNTLERYRQGFGENRPVASAPGHVFRADEFLSSVACLVQPMLAGWDAFFIPRASCGEWSTLFS